MSDGKLVQEWFKYSQNDLTSAHHLLAKPIRFNTPRLAAAVNGNVFLELFIA
jgi:hypothetical protein